MLATTRLLKKRTKRRGATKQLQALLAVLNYTIGVDGAFGQQTVTVVKKFQTNNNLTSDGIVGRGSWTMLYQVMADRFAELSQSQSVVESVAEKEKAVFGSDATLFQNFTIDNAPTASVKWIQALRFLAKEDSKIKVSGELDESTQDFIISLRTECGLSEECKVDETIWNHLFDLGLNTANQVSPLFLTDDIIQKVAREENLEVAAIGAVIKVESRGTGFYDNRLPLILFEGHIFWRELKKVDINPRSLQAKNKDIVYSKWVRKHYKGTANGEYDRLSRAKKIHKEAALRSASWGMFQIMGFNRKLSGFAKVTDFVNAMHDGEYQHLKAFIKFLHETDTYRHLKKKNWAAFAKAYNGPAFKKNGYDWKLKVAYNRNSATGTRGEDSVNVIINEYTRQLEAAFMALSI